MSQPENNKVAFNMVIDKNRAIIINSLLNGAYDNPLTYIKVEAVLQKHNIDMDRDFLDEFRKHYHECGFCNDPNCEYPESN